MKTSMAGLVAAAVIAVAAPNAHGLTFNFSFTADQGSGTDVVSGRIVGVSPGDTVADQVIIDSFPSAFGGLFNQGFDAAAWDFQLDNEFTVVGTEIVAARFEALSTDFEMQLCLGVDGTGDCLRNVNALISNVGGAVFRFNEDGFAGVTYTLQSEPVPVPAGLPLLLSGLAAVALMSRSRA